MSNVHVKHVLNITPSTLVKAGGECTAALVELERQGESPSGNGKSVAAPRQASQPRPEWAKPHFQRTAIDCATGQLP